MIVYHGTTLGNARKIVQSGFLPKPPSRAVWFTTRKKYAHGRAKQKASRGRDRAVMLTCDIDLHGLNRVMRQGHVIAVRGPVPASVLRSYPASDLSSSPEQLAAWLNNLLGLKSYTGVHPRHKGVTQLFRWLVDCQTAKPDSVTHRQLLGMARRWLPEFFNDVDIHPKTLRVHRKDQPVPLEPAPPEVVDPREEEAFDCLAASTPKRRIRGLKLLAELGDADLFDWCAMFLNDESADVIVAALETTLRCDDGDLEVILPFAESEDKRLRAVAIAALTKHSGEDASHWFERGLKDPEACVRLQTAALLQQLDPTEHREVFELARYDPNPQVRLLAMQLTAGKGYLMEW
ncbi:HEAT repeat domain-containing protein [Candidatus Poribacteria bacterium]|nr:HEAT repeat domain-containing protein [Candidatus Poribacteria bacterium]